MGLCASTTIHTDHLGGTNVVSDSDGNLEQLLSYYPFGATRIDEKESVFNEKRRFTGHELDDETGLYYMQARYQDPEVGRFASQDPVYWTLPSVLLANPQKQNSYTYGDNNPITNKDQSGEFAAPFATPLFALGPPGWVAGGVLIAGTAITAVVAGDALGEYLRSGETYTTEPAYPFTEVGMAGPSGQQNPNDFKPPRDGSSKWIKGGLVGLGVGAASVEFYELCRENAFCAKNLSNIIDPNDFGAKGGGLEILVLLLPVMDPHQKAPEMRMVDLVEVKNQQVCQEAVQILHLKKSIGPLRARWLSYTTQVAENN